MDATFLAKIRSDYPEFSFREGKRFSFRPPKTIIMRSNEENGELLLLHELGHALSGHKTFDTGARRLKMEREAWEKVREIAPKYGVGFDDSLVEVELDTYRDWLDKKTRCKKCGLTCYQTPDGVNHCPRCENFSLKRTLP
ncbi:hypothetical protein IJJ36_00090 [Candidatus Saccharibacteria bacterium]|nr:hypothetical protein [Candidatus Saccharibacteria bacterium]